MSYIINHILQIQAKTTAAGKPDRCWNDLLNGYMIYRCKKKHFYDKTQAVQQRNVITFHLPFCMWERLNS